MHLGRDAAMPSSERTELASLVGVSVVSAVGSLPFHLLPVILVAAVADERTSLAGAGWIATALVGGQLMAAFALALLRVQRMERLAIAKVGLTVVGGLWFSGLGPDALLLGWLVVGLACGALQYLGIVTAAGSARPQVALALRLGTVLTVAGVSVALLQWRNALASYGLLQAHLAAVVVVLLVVGGVLARSQVVQYGKPEGRRGGQDWLGLLVVLVLFVGQIGFLSYVVQEARTGIESAAWVLGAVKIAAGGVLLVWALRQAEDARGLLGLGAALAACVVLASAVQGVVLLVAALLAFEISFNILSARLQARVVTTGPLHARLWLTAAISLGAAIGPPLRGVLIADGLDAWFVALAAGTALAPALWSCLRSTSTTAPPAPVP
jgi:hypothetical protein